MYDNALRCTEEDYPVLLALAEDLGVITIDGEGVTPAEGVTWDRIGYKYVAGVPLENGSGQKYVHVNLRTTFSLGQRIMETAPSNPAISAALATPGRFFIVDADGNGIMPEFPIRVFL